MIRFWIQKKNRSFLQLTGGFIAVSLLFTTLSAPFAQANLWEDRRVAVKELKKDSQTLLAQLPSIHQNIFPLGTDPLGSVSIFPNFHTFPHSPSSLKSLEWITSLPENIAALKKASIPAAWKAGDPLVIYIQDAHLNKDAQNNIGKTIQHFIDQEKIDLVALEGAFEPIDVSRFRHFSQQGAVHKVADYLLRENKISGSVHAAFTSAKEIPPFIGVDDKVHYNANVDAYKNSAPKAALYKEELAKIEKKLEQEKHAQFNPNLLDFDQGVQSYRNGKEQLGKYVQSLVFAAHSPETNTFLQALKIEQTLDFSKVEKERTSLLQKLTQNLSQPQIAELLNVSLAYRVGNIKQTDFYGYFKKLCQKNGVDFRLFPAMGRYLEYVVLTDSIRAEKLFEEVKVLEEKAYVSLARTEAEKKLIAQSKYFYLLGKLLNSSLTRQEWEEYTRLGRIGFLPSFPMSLSSFEDFYKESLIRDQKISTNVLNAIKERNSKSVVLVTGGFHSDGVEESLKKSNIAVVTFVPKIAKVDTESGSAYLSAFTQEKTPLQKLFDGEKLFLPPQVLPPSTLCEAAVYIVGVLEAEDPRVDTPQTVDDARYHELSGALGRNFDVTASDISEGIAAVTSEGPQGAVPINLELAKEDGAPISHITIVKSRSLRNLFLSLRVNKGINALISFLFGKALRAIAEYFKGISLPLKKSAEGPAIRWSGHGLSKEQHDVVNDAIREYFTDPKKKNQKRLLDVRSAEYDILDPTGELDANGVTIYVFKGLNERIKELAKQRGVVPPIDLLMHPGRGRKNIYMDEEYLQESLRGSLGKQWKFIRQSLHELDHILHPEDDEATVQARTPALTLGQYDVEAGGVIEAMQSGDWGRASRGLTYLNKPDKPVGEHYTLIERFTKPMPLDYGLGELPLLNQRYARQAQVVKARHENVNSSIYKLFQRIKEALKYPDSKNLSILRGALLSLSLYSDRFTEDEQKGFEIAQDKINFLINIDQQLPFTRLALDIHLFIADGIGAHGPKKEWDKITKKMVATMPDYELYPVEAIRKFFEIHNAHLIARPKESANLNVQLPFQELAITAYQAILSKEWDTAATILIEMMPSMGDRIDSIDAIKKNREVLENELSPLDRSQMELLIENLRSESGVSRSEELSQQLIEFLSTSDWVGAAGVLLTLMPDADTKQIITLRQFVEHQLSRFREQGKADDKNILPSFISLLGLSVIGYQILNTGAAWAANDKIQSDQIKFLDAVWKLLGNPVEWLAAGIVVAGIVFLISGLSGIGLKSGKYEKGTWKSRMAKLAGAIALFWISSVLFHGKSSSEKTTGPFLFFPFTLAMLSRKKVEGSSKNIILKDLEGYYKLLQKSLGILPSKVMFLTEFENLYQRFKEDTISSEELQSLEAAIQKIEAAISKVIVQERERDLIRLRFFENETQKTVADAFEVTRERVRQIEGRIIRKLRNVNLWAEPQQEPIANLDILPPQPSTLSPVSAPDDSIDRLDIRHRLRDNLIQLIKREGIQTISQLKSKTSEEIRKIVGERLAPAVEKALLMVPSLNIFLGLVTAPLLTSLIMGATPPVRPVDMNLSADIRPAINLLNNASASLNVYQDSNPEELVLPDGFGSVYVQQAPYRPRTGVEYSLNIKDRATGSLVRKRLNDVSGYPDANGKILKQILSQDGKYIGVLYEYKSDVDGNQYLYHYFSIYDLEGNSVYHLGETNFKGGLNGVVISSVQMGKDGIGIRYRKRQARKSVLNDYKQPVIVKPNIVRGVQKGVTQEDKNYYGPILDYPYTLAYLTESKETFVPFIKTLDGKLSLSTVHLSDEWLTMEGHNEFYYKDPQPLLNRFLYLSTFYEALVGSTYLSALSLGKKLPNNNEIISLVLIGPALVGTAMMLGFVFSTVPQIATPSVQATPAPTPTPDSQPTSGSAPTSHNGIIPALISGLFVTLGALFFADPALAAENFGKAVELTVNSPSPIVLGYSFPVALLAIFAGGALFARWFIKKNKTKTSLQLLSKEESQNLKSAASNRSIQMTQKWIKSLIRENKAEIDWLVEAYQSWISDGKRLNIELIRQFKLWAADAEFTEAEIQTIFTWLSLNVPFNRVLLTQSEHRVLSKKNRGGDIYFLTFWISLIASVGLLFSAVESVFAAGASDAFNIKLGAEASASASFDWVHFWSAFGKLLGTPADYVAAAIVVGGIILLASGLSGIALKSGKYEKGTWKSRMAKLAGAFALFWLSTILFHGKSSTDSFPTPQPTQQVPKILNASPSVPKMKLKTSSIPQSPKDQFPWLGFGLGAAFAGIFAKGGAEEDLRRVVDSKTGAVWYPAVILAFKNKNIQVLKELAIQYSGLNPEIAEQAVTALTLLLSKNEFRFLLNDYKNDESSYLEQLQKEKGTWFETHADSVIKAFAQVDEGKFNGPESKIKESYYLEVLRALIEISQHNVIILSPVLNRLRKFLNALKISSMQDPNQLEMEFSKIKYDFFHVAVNALNISRLEEEIFHSINYEWLFPLFYFDLKRNHSFDFYRERSTPFSTDESIHSLPPKFQDLFNQRDVETITRLALESHLRKDPLPQAVGPFESRGSSPDYLIALGCLNYLLHVEDVTADLVIRIDLALQELTDAGVVIDNPEFNRVEALKVRNALENLYASYKISNQFYQQMKSDFNSIYKKIFKDPNFNLFAPYLLENTSYQPPEEVDLDISVGNDFLTLEDIQHGIEIANPREEQEYVSISEGLYEYWIRSGILYILQRLGTSVILSELKDNVPNVKYHLWSHNSPKYILSLWNAIKYKTPIVVTSGPIMKSKERVIGYATLELFHSILSDELPNIKTKIIGDISEEKLALACRKLEELVVSDTPPNISNNDLIIPALIAGLFATLGLLFSAVEPALAAASAGDLSFSPSLFDWSSLGLGAVLAGLTIKGNGFSFPWSTDPLDEELRKLLGAALKKRGVVQERVLEELSQKMLQLGSEKFGSLMEFLNYLARLKLSGPEQAKVIGKLLDVSFKNRELSRRVEAYLVNLIKNQKSGLLPKEENISPLFLAVAESILAARQQQLLELNEQVGRALGLLDEIAHPETGQVPEALLEQVDKFLRIPARDGSKRHDPNEFLPWLRAQAVVKPSLTPWLESVGIQSPSQKKVEEPNLDRDSIVNSMQLLEFQTRVTLRTEAARGIMDAFEALDEGFNWRNKVIVLNNLEEEYLYLIPEFLAKGARVIATDRSDHFVENFYKSYPRYDAYRRQYKDKLLILPAKESHYVTNGNLKNSKKVKRLNIEDLNDKIFYLPYDLFGLVDSEIARLMYLYPIHHFHDYRNIPNSEKSQIKQLLYARLYTKTYNLLSQPKFLEPSIIGAPALLLGLFASLGLLFLAVDPALAAESVKAAANAASAAASVGGFSFSPSLFDWSSLGLSAALGAGILGGREGKNLLSWQKAWLANQEERVKSLEGWKKSRVQVSIEWRDSLGVSNTKSGQVTGITRILPDQEESLFLDGQYVCGVREIVKVSHDLPLWEQIDLARLTGGWLDIPSIHSVKIYRLDITSQRVHQRLYDTFVAPYKDGPTIAPALLLGLFASLGLLFLAVDPALAFGGKLVTDTHYFNSFSLALSGAGILLAGLVSKISSVLYSNESRNPEELLADLVGDAMVSLYNGKSGRMNVSNAVEGILKGTSLKQGVQSVSGIAGQENLFLQRLNELDEKKFINALQKKLRKSFPKKLSADEAKYLAAQVVYGGFKMETFDAVLGRSVRGETPFIGNIIDPSTQDMVGTVSKILRRYKAVQKEGEKVAFAFFVQGSVSKSDENKIKRNAQLLNATVDFIIDPNLFQKAGESRFYHLDLVALDAKVSSWIGSERLTRQRDFSSYNLIIPQSLVGDLSEFANLPLNSIVRQATIVDALLRSAIPLLRYYENLEEIQKATHLIAEQA